ncbi:hypothetical protein [Thermomonas sp.]|uniref:hypothetical protein n=1 Tax=Thermomonas sp. TaxID=1971895 RepID=UPI0035B42DD1
MKKSLAAIFLAALVFSASAAPQKAGAPEEPKYALSFNYLNSANKAVPLEKQVPLLDAKVSFLPGWKKEIGYEYPGVASPIRFKQGEPIRLVVRGIERDIDPTNLISIIKLKIKKDRRFNPFVTASGMHVTGQQPSQQSIAYTVKEYGESSLEINPTNISPGEYVVYISNYSMDQRFFFGVDSASE